MTATLPSGRFHTSAVWDGTNAYIFGGSHNFSRSNLIVRYNPASNVVTTMTVTLPSERYGTSAVWDGTNAYIFGGNDGSSLSQIVRYNPTSNTVTAMTATFPCGRDGTSAVWDGTHAYIFGGFGGCGDATQIVRYDPASDTVTTMSANIPTGSAYASAVWDGTNAYIFGDKWDYDGSNQIVRYNPASDTVMTMSATLPTGRGYTSAVWTGASAYIFGGFDGSYSNEVVRFDPVSDTVTRMSATLPTGRYGTSAVWDGTKAYIFGGFRSAYLNEVVRYDSLSAPRSLAAQPGPGLGEITLNWQAPPTTSFGAPITNYKIYRGTTTGGETFLTTVGNVLTYTDPGLSNAEILCYKISAVSVEGESQTSGQACELPLGYPTSPRNVSASHGPGQITLSWIPPAGSAGLPTLAQRVYRADTANGSFALHASLGNVTTFIDAELAEGESHCYLVSAVNRIGEGPMSMQVCQKAPERPPAPMLTARSGTVPGTVDLTWTPRGDGGMPIQRFEVIRTSVSGGPETMIMHAKSARSWTDEQRVPGVRYHYQILAANAVGPGPRSASTSARAAILPNILDDDGDMVPTRAESQLCVSQGVQNLLELLEVSPLGHLAGRCTTPQQYNTPLATLEIFGDKDEDLVPDGFEPTICLAEVGDCVGADWGWPV